jgi:hypothetical protein
MRCSLSNWLRPAVLAMMLSGCAGGMGAPPDVPAPRPETIPMPYISAVEQVWRPGHWDWDGKGYRWIPGEYQQRTPQTNLWRSGVWERGPGGWIWHPPGWM